MLKQLANYTAYFVISSLIVISIFLYQKKTSDNSNTVAIMPIEKQFYRCRVDKVIDGDSIMALCNELSNNLLSVRFVYIDAPELSQIPWGQKAKSALTKLVQKNNNKINLLFSGKDVYNRFLAEIFINNEQSVNYTMVMSGNAVVYPRYHPPKNYLSAMQAAKIQKLGIWQKTGLQQNPQRYRRLTK